MMWLFAVLSLSGSIRTQVHSPRDCNVITSQRLYVTLSSLNRRHLLFNYHSSLDISLRCMVEILLGNPFRIGLDKVLDFHFVVLHFHFGLLLIFLSNSGVFITLLTEAV